MVENTLLGTLLVLLPTQLAYHFWPISSFVYGIRVDYFAPTLYLSDIVVLLLLFSSKIKPKTFLKNKAILFLFALMNIFLSLIPAVSAYRWLKLVEMLLLGIYFSRAEIPRLAVKSINLLFYSSVGVSIIGIFQFIKKSTLGPPFNFLGERTFSFSTPGIALVDIFGKEYMRSYSIFSHPNSLAGFLAVVLLLFLTTKLFRGRATETIGVLVVAVCFLLTFSLSAFLSLFFVLSTYFLFGKKKFFWKFGLVMIIVSILLGIVSPLFSSPILETYPGLSESIIQRLQLINVSGGLLKNNFLFGVGLGSSLSTFWLLQPVHNIFLLIFSETGIVGVLILSLLLLKAGLTLKQKNNRGLMVVLLFTILTGSVDHYWITLQQNLLLFTFLLGISFRE